MQAFQQDAYLDTKPHAARPACSSSRMHDHARVSYAALFGMNGCLLWHGRRSCGYHAMQMALTAKTGIHTICKLGTPTTCKYTTERLQVARPHFIVLTNIMQQPPRRCMAGSGQCTVGLARMAAAPAQTPCVHNSAQSCKVCDHHPQRPVRSSLH
jgi:hypothetical protein